MKTGQFELNLITAVADYEAYATQFALLSLLSTLYYKSANHQLQIFVFQRKTRKFSVDKQRSCLSLYVVSLDFTRRSWLVSFT